MKEKDNKIQVLIEKYEDIEDIIDEQLHKILLNNLSLVHVMHRIKTIDSIKGKLVRKPDLYSTPYEIYDILGFRIICYFSNDVDLDAKLISENFKVDWNRSKDKRKLIDAKSFGYVALHYVCALPERYGELSNLWFEIQIKTILQHSWAEIEYDLGYKSEFEVPRRIQKKLFKSSQFT